MAKNKDLNLTVEFTKNLAKSQFIDLLGIAKILSVHLKKEGEVELIDFPELWSAIVDKFYNLKIHQKEDFLNIIKELIEDRNEKKEVL